MGFHYENTYLAEYTPKNYVPFSELMKLDTPEAKKQMLGDTYEHRQKRLAQYPVLQDKYVMLRQKYGAEDETVIYLHKELERIEKQYMLKSPFKVGWTYRLMSGQHVKFLGVTNEGTEYETMYDELGHHRYTTRDYGRTTGTNERAFARFIDLSFVNMNGFVMPYWWVENGFDDPDWLRNHVEIAQ